VLSGLTAFPLESELQLLASLLPDAGQPHPSMFTRWIVTVRNGLIETNAKYPFLAYGTDWLAFAHLVIAVAFIGPLRDPVRNVWVIDFGLIACAAVIPLALIAGQVRGIPFGWRLIDCSFGVFGAISLLLARQAVIRAVREKRQDTAFTCGPVLPVAFSEAFSRGRGSAVRRVFFSQGRFSGYVKIIYERASYISAPTDGPAGGDTTATRRRAAPSRATEQSLVADDQR
jgi:hypothetical protein